MAAYFEKRLIDLLLSFYREQDEASALGSF